ncbi:Mur ligase family protein [Agromyces seonyuensis]|uniref:UDP-N-acetylmuramyl-tripeptide synthetase n=1 Tax=Agromyces seonyuensis TaxID=2662446 RepID=A0A6I4P3V6_9MICO|nr:UDP-N-acetylmuramoyl-L-alanyl-D-glutamate--2,6-diaminopimelate ligase [Agromyces seonyuensis]MWB98899.1 UDP-N-acetylmuramyl-tripeptide synthetase [Agromyces seonyuensis]
MPPVETHGLRPESVRPRSLGELAAAVPAIQVRGDLDTTISGVAVSTKDLRPGELFVAIPGANRHGAEFAAAAAAAGAGAVLTDEAGFELASATGLPVLIVDSPRDRLGDVAAAVFGTDVHRPKLFAVTGTNGKTSVVHMIEAILRQLGIPSGLSSTAERHVRDLEVVSGLTTPEASELHALLALMNEAGVEAAAVEVSAQALSRHRVDGVVFDVVGFTNLSHDHLDDYGTMTAYLDAKRPLFTPQHGSRAVVSLDTPAGAELFATSGIPAESISADPAAAADWLIEVVSREPGRTGFRLSRSGQTVVESSVPVLGDHMAANAGLAIAMLIAGGVDGAGIAAALGRDGGIRMYLPGRIEKVSDDASPGVYVDFGHSPDAFAKSLAAVRAVTPGKVVMVFGADGDRDKIKRPDMARAAVDGSDLLIVTDHHPRFEDPASIRATLVRAAREHKPGFPVLEVADPKQAIREAMRHVQPGDSILWAGPGHQNYRDIEGVKTPYSAKAEARAALVEHGFGASENLATATAY